MKHPSASNAEAFVRCTASHVLPQHEHYTEATEKGTDGHALIAAVLNKEPGAGAKLAKAYPDLGFKLQGLVQGIGFLSAETAYVVDVQKRKSVYLGKNIGRDYAGKLGRELAEYEIGTSLDMQGLRDGKWWIRDTKFGTHSSWWQLYIQAMAVLWQDAGAVDSSSADVDAGFIHILDQDGETRVEEDSSTLYLMDLDDRADEMMTAFGRAKSIERQLEAGTSPSDLKVVEGAWCKYCGAFPHCPAKWKLAKSMLDLDVVGHISALSPEQCGAAWLKLKEIEKNIITKTKDALRERMRAEGGFPLENGKRLRVIQANGRSSLDREATMALLLEKGATEKEIQGLFRQGKPYDVVKEMKS